MVFALGALVVVDVGGGGGSQMASPTSLEASAAGDFDRTGATPATGGGTDDDTNVESADDDSGADGADEASGQPPLGESEGGSRSRAAAAGQAELSGDVAVQDGRLDAASDSTFGALRIAQIALGATALIAFVTTVALWRRAKGIHT